MGVERYKHLLGTRRGRASYTPALFEPERFFDFRSRDTNINPHAGKFESHYAKARRRFDQGTVRYIGDRVREDEPIIGAIEANFPAPKFFFIYRDPLHVASSFAVRAKDPRDTNWPATQDAEAGVVRWHAAFATAEGLLDRAGAENVLVVRYERLFKGDARACEAIFGFLGLTVTLSVQRHFARRTADWDRRQAKPLELSTLEREDVSRRVDREVLDRFDRRFEHQLTRYAGV